MKKKEDVKFNYSILLTIIVTLIVGMLLFNLNPGNFVGQATKFLDDSPEFATSCTDYDDFVVGFTNGVREKYYDNTCSGSILVTDYSCKNNRINKNSVDVCANGCSNGRCNVCGDGVVSGSEECDDGNSLNIDGCNDVCEIEGYCCFDNVLGIGTFSLDGCIGDNPNLEIELSGNAQSCKYETINNRDYRYADYYKTTPKFALVCTSDLINQCTISDINFMDASFEGHILGVNSLSQATGNVLPRRKMEFHVGRDADCFTNGYGTHPTGYILSGDHYFQCSSEYWWYLESQGTNWERDLDYERSLQSQVLTIHEPLHRIFSDYVPDDIHLSGGPAYVIQESFAKAVSLFATGYLSGYSDQNSILNGYGVYSVSNPPPVGTPSYNDFFVYSLNQRYGFDEGHDTMDFFQEYRDTQDSLDLIRVKTILDDIMNQDTLSSFNDLGLSYCCIDNVDQEVRYGNSVGSCPGNFVLSLSTLSNCQDLANSYGYSFLK